MSTLGEIGAILGGVWALGGLIWLFGGFRGRPMTDEEARKDPTYGSYYD